jgi:hypothetical protein
MQPDRPSQDSRKANEMKGNSVCVGYLEHYCNEKCILLTLYPFQMLVICLHSSSTLSFSCLLPIFISFLYLFTALPLFVSPLSFISLPSSYYTTTFTMTTSTIPTPATLPLLPPPPSHMNHLHSTFSLFISDQDLHSCMFKVYMYICLLRKQFLNRAEFVITWLTLKFIGSVCAYILSKTVCEIQHHTIDTNNILFNCYGICLRV